VKEGHRQCTQTPSRAVPSLTACIAAPPRPTSTHAHAPPRQCAGFLPNDPRFAELLQQAKVDVPSLFIMGAADALIPPHRTQVCVCVFVRGLGRACTGAPLQ
jgi:hypothetical protein